MSQTLEVVEQYIQAWNQHDAGKLVALFAESGMYQDPNGAFQPQDLGVYAQSLWETFPDLAFDVTQSLDNGNGQMSFQWVMTGTHRGDFNGLPPTGHSIRVPGADFIEIQNGKIQSVTGYFDASLVPKQLGLQILVQPHQLGPFNFGNAVLAEKSHGKKPGAFTITNIWNQPHQDVEVQQRSRDVAKEMLEKEGVLGVMLSRVGRRGITVTAWDHPDDVAMTVTHLETHRTSMQRFWDDLADAAYTSVWAPLRSSPMYVRCGSCKMMSDYHRDEGNCTCGAPLPEPPAFF